MITPNCKKTVTVTVIFKISSLFLSSCVPFSLGSLRLFEQFNKSTLADKFELYSSFYSNFEAIKKQQTTNKKYSELIFEG